MYYWLLLNKSDDDLAKKIYQTQKQHRCKDDWVTDIEENLKLCEIQLSESDVWKMRQNKFRK